LAGQPPAADDVGLVILADVDQALRLAQELSSTPFERSISIVPAGCVQPAARWNRTSEQRKSGTGAIFSIPQSRK
jgi:hypothetical protein